MYIGIMLMFFKIEGNIPEPFFNNFRILVGMLLGPSLSSRFKEEIMLQKSVLLVGVLKNDSIFKDRKQISTLTLAK